MFRAFCTIKSEVRRVGKHEKLNQSLIIKGEAVVEGKGGVRGNFAPSFVHHTHTTKRTEMVPLLTVRERERAESEIAHFESDVIMIQLNVPNINEFLMSEVLGF